jgi:plastocyanin
MGTGRARRLALLAGTAGAVLALAGWPLPLPGPAAAQPAGNDTKVSMKDFAFMPASITVKAGTTVTWTYDESATDPMPNCETPVLTTQCPGHTATATDKGADGKPLFDSGTLKGAGKSYSFTFTKPGTYAYYCVFHGGTTATGKNNPITNMNGTVVVEAAAATAPETGSTGAPAPAAGPGTAVQGESTARSSAQPAASGDLAQSGGRQLLAWGLAPLAGALVLHRRRRQQH